ncbi:MAG: glycosyltransferase family 1 protein [Firmicutes bacterium HGW-Firmicutes-14]|nr:MAG: glycosyltransferase family 1 protein [Firmicutes bacterium HGW-Firmicutes-14]
MQIVIDARMVSEQMHGIARYTYNLAERFSEIDNENNYILLVNNDYLAGFVKDKPNLEIYRVKSSFISTAEQVELPFILKKLGPDLFHTPSFVAPAWCPCRLVMTVHDVNHMVFPQYYAKIHQVYYKYIVRPSAHKAKTVLTVSEFSKGEITRYLGVAPDKIEVTYNGVDSGYRLIKDRSYLDRVREKYCLPEHFILCVSNNKPHKNLKTLLQAFARADTNYSLILSVDPKGEEDTLAGQLGISGRVRFTGHIPDRDLPGLYNLAGLFVFPSLYEGFGLPPLEAMACGTPVIVSSAASLPEVAGDAGIMVEPRDVEGLAQAIGRVLKDQPLRAEMTEKGFRQAQKFTWDNTARETLRVYREVGRGHSGNQRR